MSKILKLASWNVNSVKARGEHVQKYCADFAPDILMMQELKGETFPSEDFKAIGYHSVAATQKAYNGVAILSKNEIELIHDRLPGMEDDDQARYLEANISGIRVINIYLPNGNPVDTDKFPYKLRWMDALIERAKILRAQHIPFLIAGDFNIIPEDKDCHDPSAWRGDALFHEESLAKWRSLLNIGLYDAYRIVDGSDEVYSFWDYQRGAWQKNDGIRIDHFLLSPQLADQMIACEIHKEPRGWDRPSDHTPIALSLKLD